MSAHPLPHEPSLLAVAAFDELVAETVKQARKAGVDVPPRFFDWAAGEGTRLVERLVQKRLAARWPYAASESLMTATRCAVRYWIAPPIVARFEQLRPFFPELAVRSETQAAAMLVRNGRWRCPSAQACIWKLCEWGGGA